jgi:hypothetical protein
MKERCRELHWPRTAVERRSGRVMFIYDNDVTAERLVRAGLVWPSIVGPVQRPGYVVTVAMTIAEDLDACRFEAFCHGAFSAVQPILADGRVARRGLSELAGAARSRCACATYWADAADQAGRYWRREVRLNATALGGARIRQALNFGPDEGAHVLWRVESAGRLTIPGDLHAAIAQYDVVDAAQRTSSMVDNPPRYALALGVQACIRWHDVEDFYSVDWERA